MKLPRDIAKKIENEVKDAAERDKLFALCLTVYRKSINVGHEQLVRSTLVMSKFNPTKFEEILEGNFYGDPRDVIMAANALEPSLGHGLKKFK